MEIERFKEIIDGYGTSVARWPEAEKEAALRMILQSDEARGYTEDAAFLDQNLNLLPKVEPRPALVAQILREIEPVALKSPLLEGIRLIFWPFGPIWRPAVGLALALMLGLFSGTLFDPYGLIDLNAQEVAEEELTALTFGPEFDLEDLE